MFTYLPIPTDDRVPEGYGLIVAYAKGDRVFIPLDVTQLKDEELHNCDWEGCSSVEHVVTFSIHDKYTADKKPDISKIARDIVLIDEADEVINKLGVIASIIRRHLEATC